MFHVKHSAEFFRFFSVSRETINAKNIPCARKNDAERIFDAKMTF